VQLLQLSNRRQQCVGRGKLLTIKVPEHTQVEKLQLSEEEQWSVVSLQKRTTNEAAEERGSARSVDRTVATVCWQSAV
jgi:hypothetical protein